MEQEPVTSIKTRKCKAACSNEKYAYLIRMKTSTILFWYILSMQ